MLSTTIIDSGRRRRICPKLLMFIWPRTSENLFPSHRKEHSLSSDSASIFNGSVLQSDSKKTLANSAESPAFRARFATASIPSSRLCACALLSSLEQNGSVVCYYYPGQKKRTIIGIRGEKNAVPRVISCSIRPDQRRAKVADRTCPALIAPDRA